MSVALAPPRVTELAAMMRAAPDRRHPTCLYFVQDESGPIKVGVTQDPQARLRVMKNGNPRRLTTLALFCVNPFAERDVHNMLDREGCRIHGEWFEPHPRIFDLIRIYTEAGFAWA